MVAKISLRRDYSLTFFPWMFMQKAGEFMEAYKREKHPHIPPFPPLES